MVFISPETLRQPITVKPVGQNEAADQVRPDKPAEPVRLQGHEWKTKQGNKLWVVAGASVGQGKAVSQNKPVDQGGLVKSPEKPVNHDGPVVPHDIPVDQRKPVDSVAEGMPIEPVQLFGHEKKTRQGNKQWVTAGIPASHQGPVESVGQESQAQPIQLIGHEKKTRQGNKQWVKKPVLQENLVRPVGLVGHEKKTKRGNKQWVVAGLTPRRRVSRLVGHEKKTKHGNKQWVVAGLTPRRRVSRRYSRTKHRPSLVSFNGGRYSMDHTGKRLKRLSTSSSQLACLSPAITGYLGSMISSSAKRIKARYVCSGLL